MTLPQHCRYVDPARASWARPLQRETRPRKYEAITAAGVSVPRTGAPARTHILRDGLNTASPSVTGATRIRGISRRNPLEHSPIVACEQLKRITHLLECGGRLLGIVPPHADLQAVQPPAPRESPTHPHHDGCPLPLRRGWPARDGWEGDVPNRQLSVRGLQRRIGPVRK